MVSKKPIKQNSPARQHTPHKGAVGAKPKKPNLGQSKK